MPELRSQDNLPRAVEHDAVSHWTDIELAQMAKCIRIIRPKNGKPSIEHMASATQHVVAALEAHGWKDIKKVAKRLTEKGFAVKMYGEGGE